MEESLISKREQSRHTDSRSADQKWFAESTCFVDREQFGSIPKRPLWQSEKREKYLFCRAKIWRPLRATRQRKRLKRFDARMLSFVERNEIRPMEPQWKPFKGR